jgi:outer membrane protein TolC
MNRRLPALALALALAVTAAAHAGVAAPVPAPGTSAPSSAQVPSLALAPASLPPPASAPASPAASLAQPAPAGAALRLTLAETVERARQASAHLAELQSAAAAAGAGLTGARAQRLPQIDVSAGYTRLSDVPELRVDLPGLGLQTLFPNIPDNYRAHLGVALPLYTGGRIARTIDANAQQLVAANQDVEQARADLVLEAVDAYWSLVTDRDSESVLGASLADYESHLKESRDRQAVGMAAANEVLAVEVQRDQAELARLQAATAAAVANANLLRLLDLPAGTRIEPVEPLAAPLPGAPIPSATPAPAAGPLTIPTAEAPEPLIAAAVAARPEILALRGRVAAGRASAEALRATLRPQASLSGGYDYANPNDRILPLEARWRTSWSLGALVSLSLFDGGRTTAAAAQSEAQADSLEHRIADLERRIRLEITQRLLELTAARQAAVVAQRGLDSAHENVRVARDRYHEGVIPSSELLDAEIALLRAGLDRTNALAQVRIAAANLDRAVGR